MTSKFDGQISDFLSNIFKRQRQKTNCVDILCRIELPYVFKIVGNLISCQKKLSFEIECVGCKLKKKDFLCTPEENLYLEPIAQIMWSKTI